MSASDRPRHDEELLSYRVLSTWAVISLVLGVLSVLAFVPLWPLKLVPLCAIVTGVHALRRIAYAPTEWAGKRLAQTGIGLALILGVSSIVTHYGERAYLRWHGRAVADRFVAKLVDGDIEAAFWLASPKYRRELMRKNMNPTLIRQYAEFHHDLEQDLADLGEDARFQFKEMDQDSNWVFYRIISPQDDQRELMVMVSNVPNPDTNRKEWFVAQFRFGSTHEFDLFGRQAQTHGHSH